MEKDLLQKKFGLPPVPSFAGGAAKKRALVRKRDYTPVLWDNYFEKRLDVDVGDGDVFRVYCSGTEGPVVLFLHGGGFSALSWSLLTAHLVTLVKCCCVAIDLRGHGDTHTSDNVNLSREQLSHDVANVMGHLYEHDVPPVILVGHSMGGAIAVDVAYQNLIPSVIGLAVIDVVEGTALEALNSMQSFLRSRPKVFDSIDKAVEWAVRSGHIMNLESAKVSMVGQLKCLQTDETGLEELEQAQYATYEIIVEEDSSTLSGENSEAQKGSSSESTSSNSATQLSDNAPCPKMVSSDTDTETPSCSLDLSKPAPGYTMGHKYTWRIDLTTTEPFWKGWFEGLSKKFLECTAPKVLILAGADRLDKDLTIGQMQGKFQMNLIPQCGHAVQEDNPDKVAELLAAFMARHKVAEPLAQFHPHSSW